MRGRSLPVRDAHSNKSPQQAADALYNATQQTEDAGQQATYGAAEAAKNSHPTPLELQGSSTRDTRPDT